MATLLNEKFEGGSGAGDGWDDTWSDDWAGWSGNDAWDDVWDDDWDDDDITVANSDWDVITLGGAGPNTYKFDPDTVLAGSLASRFTENGDGTAIAREDFTAETLFAFRAYYKLDALPVINMQIAALLSDSTDRCDVRVLTGGELQIRDASQSEIHRSTMTLPIDQWFRLELVATLHASAGWVEAKLYTGLDPHAGSPNEVVGNQVADEALGGSANNFRTGIMYGGTSIANLWLDDVRLDGGTTTYLGPSTNDLILSAEAFGTASPSASLTNIQPASTVPVVFFFGPS